MDDPEDGRCTIHIHDPNPSKIGEEIDILTSLYDEYCAVKEGRRRLPPLGVRNEDQMIVPELYVGGQKIDFPLSEDHAHRIMLASHDAQPAVQMVNPMLLSGSNVWVLPPGQFEIRDSELADMYALRLKELVDEIGNELYFDGGSSGLHVEPSSLLLLGRGAESQSDLSIEDVPGVYGTLAICLPSQHRGGHVNVRFPYCNDKRTFTLSTSGAGQPYFWCHPYVNQRILSVDEGYMVVLTYNLTTEDPTICIKDMATDTQKLELILQFWEEHPEQEQFEWRDWDLYIQGLEHRYPKAQLHLNRLEGEDRRLAMALRKACGNTGFHVFLGTLVSYQDIKTACIPGDYGFDESRTKTTEAFIYPDDMEEQEDSLTDVFTLTGDPVLSLRNYVEVYNGQFLQSDPFGKQDPGSEKWYPNRKHTRASILRTCIREVIFVIPSRSVGDFYQTSMNIRGACCHILIEHVARRCCEENSEISKARLRSVCECVVRTNLKGEGIKYPDTAVLSAANACSLISDVSLLARTVASFKSYPPPEVRELIEKQLGELPGSQLQQVYTSFPPNILHLFPTRQSLQRTSLSLVKFYYQEYIQDTIDSSPILSMVDHRERQDDSLLPSMQGKVLSQFLQNCFDLGFARILHKALVGIQKELPKMDPETIYDISISCSREMLRILPKSNIPFDRTFYPSVVRNLLDCCLIHYVGEEPVQVSKPSNWRFREVSGGVSWNWNAPIIKRLNNFLRNPNRRTRIFRGISKWEQSHIKSMLKSGGIKYNASLKGKNMTITKIHKHDYNHAAWKERMSKVSRDLAEFDQEALRVALGDRYEEMTNMRKLKAAVNPEKGTTSATAQGE